jgi:AcrR family transcriptional regulator
MPQPLVDLLWRDHPHAPRGGSRGPRARVATGDVVQAAIRLADADGLAAVRIRDLAASLGVSTMAIYTHVNSRADLLVLMVDAVHASMTRPTFGRAGWRTRVRRLAEANLALLRDHPWLLEVSDDRVVFGPGTIAKYDHELHAFDGMGLDDVTRDAALTFVLDFVRASARALLPHPPAADTAALWRQWQDRLAEYVGDAYPLAQRVGAAAGAAMNAAHDPMRAYEFGLERVLAALADLQSTSATDQAPALTGPNAAPDGSAGTPSATR